MPQFGLFRGISESLFGDKLFAGQVPVDLGNTKVFAFTINTNNAGVTSNTQFRLPLTTSTGLDFVISWGDGVVERITSHTAAEVTHTYPSSGIYQIQISGSILGWQFNNGGDRQKMLNIITWGALNISVGDGFYGCANLTCSATDAPVISGTSLSQYFRACSNFNGAIGNWNVSSVTNMSSIFNSASSFNQNIGSWNVSSVTTMQSMFNVASAFNQNIGSWNVANVTNFTNFMAGKTNLNYSAANLDAIYNGWSASGVKPNITISFGTIKYTSAGSAGRAILTGSPNNWSITDGGI